MQGVIVEVSARRFAVPFECPCCGATPDTEVRVPLARSARSSAAPDTAQGLEFPYCQRCRDHAERFESAGMVSAGVVVLALVASVVVALVTQLVFGLLVFLGAIPVAVILASSRRSLAAADCGEACAAPGNAVAYRGWTGTVTSFAFSSPTYTARFAEQNAAVLANTTQELRKLLEGYKIARAAVPTPAVAASALPPPIGVRDWIARIEISKGKAARRNAVARALDALHESADRRELIETVARIELASVLEKVRAAGSAGTKRQLLDQAIAEVRADNLPQELQEAETKALEARLAELG